MDLGHDRGPGHHWIGHDQLLEHHISERSDLLGPPDGLNFHDSHDLSWDRDIASIHEALDGGGGEFQYLVHRNGHEDPLGTGSARRCDRDDTYRDHQFGPLAGIHVYSPSGGDITVYAEDGWEIEDVRSLWKPIMDLVGTKGLKMDDELMWYLEYRKDVGMDR